MVYRWTHSKAFAVSCYKLIYYIALALRRKLDNSYKEGIFLGYAEKSKGYIYLDKETNNLILSENVICLNDWEQLKC